MGKRIELTPRDIATFTHLRNDRHLHFTYLHAFVGGASEKRFKEPLGALFHEGCIDRPDEQWRFANCRYRPAVYELGNGGRRILDSRGVAVAPKSGRQ